MSKRETLEDIREQMSEEEKREVEELARREALEREVEELARREALETEQEATNARREEHPSENLPKDESKGKEYSEEDLKCKVCKKQHRSIGKLLSCYKQHKREGTIPGYMLPDEIKLLSNGSTVRLLVIGQIVSTPEGNCVKIEEADFAR